MAEFHGIAFLADLRHYVIQGGIDGRERLRVIARGMGPTMSALFDRVGIAEGLASREEVDGIVRELYDFARDPNTLAGLPRVVQAWGQK